ncbi:MAG: hypothetical protein AB8B67_01730 [Rickettsiaceae bacterium]
MKNNTNRFDNSKLLLCILFITLSCLVSCAPIKTNVAYDANYKSFHASSEPIYLELNNTDERPFYFILNHDKSQNVDGNYFLSVMWSTTTSEQLSDGYNTALQLLINNNIDITLHPVKKPGISAYIMDQYTHEEEVIFELTFDQMKIIANAKKVSLLLKGKNLSIGGRFTNHTLKAFKDFFISS